MRSFIPEYKLSKLVTRACFDLPSPPLVIESKDTKTSQITTIGQTMNIRNENGY